MRPQQLDLLNDWTPPEATVAFDESRVRAADLKARISLAVAAAMKDCPHDRKRIAKEMSLYLGEDVSMNMLNAYASQARDAHRIPLERFVALIHVTRDRRLLELVAEMFRWTVIDVRHLPLIELAALRERQREIGAAADALARHARSRGGL